MRLPIPPLGHLFYNLKNVTVFTDDYGQVKLFIKVVHYLVDVSVHKEHVEMIEVNLHL